MSQNTSHAVMSQRQEARDSLDDFPTPPWATRALMQYLISNPEQAKHMTCWEPACNRLHMVNPLREYFGRVHFSDVHGYETGALLWDFLMPHMPTWLAERPDFIITNPPFRLAEAFVMRALEIATYGVAILVRTQFLEGGGRYQRLFKDRPPMIVGQFAERVPMVKGRIDQEASTATSYCWLLWSILQPDRVPVIKWIPPCRKTLELVGDYDAA